MSKEKIVIVGCGERGREIKEFIERNDLFDVIGFSVNRQYINEDSFLELPVYPLEELDKFIDKDKVYTFVAVSQFNYLNRVKKKLYNYLKEHDYKVANLISPQATIHSPINGDGNIFYEFSYIGEDAVIGSNNSFKPYSYIAHYCNVGNHNFFGVGSILAGACKVGDQCFVGIKATAFQNVHIGNKCIIGACTVIKKNVKDYCLVKVSDSSVEVHEYGENSIEEKLAPRPTRYVNPNQRTTYATIKHDV